MWWAACRALSHAGNAVLYTAHYDHLGIDPDAKGDNIYNGAADNGTGCGILMEMARAFAQSTERPPHDVYFASVTAEEQGLLGSQYLGMHPPVPAGTVCARPQLRHAAADRDSALGGSERGRAHQLLAHGAGLWRRPSTCNYCPTQIPWPVTTIAPIISRWRASAFPRFQSIRASCSKGTTQAWGHAQTEDYVAHHYHQPSDEYHADWDFRGNAKLARFGFVLGWLASEQPKPVEWLRGDEFEAARKASEAQ